MAAGRELHLQRASVQYVAATIITKARTKKSWTPAAVTVLFFELHRLLINRQNLDTLLLRAIVANIQASAHKFPGGLTRRLFYRATKLHVDGSVPPDLEMVFGAM